MLMTYKLKTGDGLIKELVFLLLISLMVSPVAGASTKPFNFTMQNYTGLNFENGSYMVEVIEINSHNAPKFVKVNLSTSGSSKSYRLYESENPFLTYPFNKIDLRLSSITEASALIMIELPVEWGHPNPYQIVIPVAPVEIPNIVLTKSVDKTNVNVGDVLQIKIIAENKGNGTAYNLTLIEPLLPNGLTIAPTSRTPVIKDKLNPGEIDDQPYYGVKAVESGTFNIEPTIVKYGSKTSKSNPITIIVAEPLQKKSNLITVIGIDKKNVYTDEQIKVTIKINNTGNAIAKSIRVKGTPPLGMEVVEGDLKHDYEDAVLNPGETTEYRATLKATEAGNFSINLITFYNDNLIGVSSESENLIVTQKERNYLYILGPIIIILVGIVLFTIKRHREYSY